MYIEELNLRNFRNYGSLDLKANPFLNIFIGDNAQGKTNILEAVYYTATGRSHRTSKENELLRWQEKYFQIEVQAEKYQRKIKIEIISLADNRKKLKINGVPKKRMAELVGEINVVLFSPEDLMLVKGGPVVRRKYLDNEISQVSHTYCHNLINYNKALFQRNNLLRSIREGKEKPQSLDIWDMQLAEFGQRIICKRLEVLKKLMPLARLMHRKITNGLEELEIRYYSSVDLKDEVSGDNIKENFIQLLNKLRREEITRGITLAGPHRDDFGLFVLGQDMRLFGSQGQQRTCALSMKMAELEFMRAETGEYPILLLDDVMSELDDHRRKFLLEVVYKKIQTFITATTLTYFKEIGNKEYTLFEVNKGTINTECRR